MIVLLKNIFCLDMIFICRKVGRRETVTWRWGRRIFHGADIFFFFLHCKNKHFNCADTQSEQTFPVRLCKKCCTVQEVSYMKHFVAHVTSVTQTQSPQTPLSWRSTAYSFPATSILPYILLVTGAKGIFAHSLLFSSVFQKQAVLHLQSYKYHGCR